MSDSQKIYLHSDAATSTETEKSVKTRLIRKQKVSTEFENKKLKEQNNSTGKQTDSTDYSLRSKTRKIMVSPAPTLHQFFNVRSTESSSSKKLEKILCQSDDSVEEAPAEQRKKDLVNALNDESVTNVVELDTTERNLEPSHLRNNRAGQIFKQSDDSEKETPDTQRRKDSVNELDNESEVSGVELEILEKYRKQSQPKTYRPVQHTEQLQVDEINPSRIDEKHSSNHGMEPDKFAVIANKAISDEESSEDDEPLKKLIADCGLTDVHPQLDGLAGAVVQTVLNSTRLTSPTAGTVKIAQHESPWKLPKKTTILVNERITACRHTPTSTNLFLALDDDEDSCMLTYEEHEQHNHLHNHHNTPIRPESNRTVDNVVDATPTTSITNAMAECDVTTSVEYKVNPELARVESSMASGALARAQIDGNSIRSTNLTHITTCHQEFGHAEGNMGIGEGIVELLLVERGPSVQVGTDILGKSTSTSTSSTTTSTTTTASTSSSSTTMLTSGRKQMTPWHEVVDDDDDLVDYEEDTTDYNTPVVNDSYTPNESNIEYITTESELNPVKDAAVHPVTVDGRTASDGDIWNTQTEESLLDIEANHLQCFQEQATMNIAAMHPPPGLWQFLMTKVANQTAVNATSVGTETTLNTRGPYTTTLIRKFEWKTGRPATRLDNELVREYQWCHYRLFCHTLAPEPSTPVKKTMMHSSTAGLVEDYLFHGKEYTIGKASIGSYHHLAQLYSSILQTPNAYLNQQLTKTLMKHLVRLDQIVHWKEAKGEMAAHPLKELKVMVHQLNGIDSTINDKSDSRLLLRFLYAVGSKIFDSTLSFYVQLIEHADTLQLLHVVSACTIELLLLLYQNCWRILPTQMELRFQLCHEQLRGNGASAFVHRLVCYRNALIQHKGLRQYAKDFVGRTLKELEKQFDRFRVPDDHLSVSLRTELEQRTAMLLECSWGLLHDTSMAEPTSTGHPSRTLVIAVARQILPTVNSLLRSYKKHCVNDLNYYLVSSSKQTTWEAYIHKVADLTRDVLHDFMGSELYFRETSEGCRRLILTPLREILSPPGYNTTRNTVDLFLIDLIQVILQQPLSNLPEGETDKAVTDRLSTYLADSLVPPEALDVGVPQLIAYIKNALQILRRDNSHYSLHSVVARIRLYDEATVIPSPYYENRRTGDVRQLLSKSGRGRPNLLDPSAERVLETHSKHWLIDGFPTNTQDDEIIAEVRYLANLAGIGLVDKELRGKLNRVPRKSGKIAVLLTLDREYHFIHPHDERDQPKSIPYHGKYVGQRVLPTKANKKRNEVRRAHYLCQPIAACGLSPQLIANKMVQVGFFAGFPSEQGTLRAALATAHLYVADKLKGHDMPILLLAEVITQDLMTSGHTAYKVYDPVLVVLSGALSTSQLGLLKRLLGLDSTIARVLALPGFSITHQGGDVKHKPQPLHEDILLSARETIAYHIPIPANLTYHGVLDILRKEAVARHILLTYGTTPGYNENLTAASATHLTVHASKLLPFSQFFAEVIGGGWTAKSSMMGLLSLDQLELRNKKLIESAEFEADQKARKKDTHPKRASDVHHNIPRKISTWESTDLPQMTAADCDDTSRTTLSTITMTPSVTSKDRDDYLIQLGTLVEDQTLAIHMLVNEISGLKETVGSMSNKIEQHEACILDLQTKLGEYTAPAVIPKFTPPILSALRIPGVGRALASASSTGGSARST